MSDLKLFTMDCGYRGSISVIAETENQARDIMSDEPNYDDNLVVTEQEIIFGLVISNLGDM
jgi:hypothetical protein